jgi:hypothetical protein
MKMGGQIPSGLTPNPKKEVIMTTQDKLVRRKLSLLELAEFLKNVSQACKINGVSRQHFYDIKKAYDEHGIEGLKEKTRQRPCIKNRVAPEVEDAVVKMAYEYPAYGQLRASNELRKAGILYPVAEYAVFGSDMAWRPLRSD